MSWYTEGLQHRLEEWSKEGPSRTSQVPARTGIHPVLLSLSSSSLQVCAHMWGDRSGLENSPAAPRRMHPFICFYMLTAMGKEELFSDVDACCILMKIKIPFPFLTLMLRDRSCISSHQTSFPFFFFAFYTSFRFYCLLHQNKSSGPAQI